MGRLAAGIAGRVPMFVAHAAGGTLAVLAVDTDLGAGDAIALGDLTGNAGAGLRGRHSARRS
jgi:hypothetical protein